MNYDALWNDDASDEEFAEAYQNLIDNGQAWHLEGSVGRTAMDLIQSGVLMFGPKPVRDYWGNIVPAWWMIEPGAPGSPEFAGRERPREPSDEEKRELLRTIGMEVV